MLRDFSSDNSDKDKDFPSLRKLLLSLIHEKISTDVKPSPNSTTKKVNSRTLDPSRTDSSSLIASSY
jgi:hypothetical protein